MADQLQLAQQLNNTLQQAQSNMSEIEARVTTQISIINNLNQTLDSMSQTFTSFNTSVTTFANNIKNIVENVKASFNLEELTELYEELENHAEGVRKNLDSTSDAINEVSENVKSQSETANDAAKAASQAASNSKSAGLSVQTFSRTSLKNTDKARTALSEVGQALGVTAEAAEEATSKSAKFFGKLKSAMKNGVGGAIFKSIITVIGATVKAFKTILTLPAQMAKGAAIFGNGLRKDLVEVIGNAIQQTKDFFDLNSNIGQGIRRLGSIGSGMLATFKVAGSNMVKLFGFGTAGIVNMIKEFQDVLVAIGPFAEMFGATIADSKEQIEFFASMKRAYGLANEDYAYYALDASSKLQDLNSRIFQMGETVFAVADEYGLDRKRLSLNFQKLRKDIVNFDHLTDEELANTTAKITQMKVKIEDVAAIFNKFSTFEDAAKSVALLSQTFGMNLDAMQLIRAEKPEEIFETFRNSMMQTGKSFETLNRFEKQLLANQTGMSAETLKSIMNFRDAGLTYEQAVERANNSKPEKQQLKALKELRSAIKEVQKVMEFESPFDAFFKGLKANALATGEFSSTLMNLSKGYEGIYNYAAGLDANTFFGILKPIKMIVDIMTKIVSSKGFKTGLVKAVETVGKLVSGAFGVGKGVSETFNIVSNIQKLSVKKDPKQQADLTNLLNSFDKDELRKLGVGKEFLKSISKKSSYEQIQRILIKMRKNVQKNPKLQKAHDIFISKFQKQYQTIDNDYNARYNLVDEVKNGLKTTSQSMIDSAGDYVGLAGTIAGALIQGAAIILTAGLEFLSESLAPVAKKVSDANSEQPSKTALEKIFGWNAGETSRMFSGLGNAFMGLFTTGNNMNIIGSLVSVFATVIGNALLMIGSVLKGILWDSWDLWGDDADDMLKTARDNASSSAGGLGGGIGISSSFNELKFDTGRLDSLMSTLEKIEGDNTIEVGTSGGSMARAEQMQYSDTAVKQTQGAFAQAGITEKDHFKLQADLASQSEQIHKELTSISKSTSTGPVAKAAQASQAKLAALDTRLKELVEAYKDGGSFTDSTGVEYDMTNQQLSAEMLQVYNELQEARADIKQGKAVRDTAARLVPGRRTNYVKPIDSQSDITTNGQAGFANAMTTKFKKIEVDSEVSLDLSSYSNKTKNFVASNSSDELTQKCIALSEGVDRLDKCIDKNSAEDRTVDISLSNEIIKQIWQQGASLGCVSILQDPRYTQGVTSLSSIGTNHSAMQPGRVGRGYTTSYNVEHNK